MIEDLFDAASQEINRMRDEYRREQLSIQAFAYNALRCDGAHHKQWFLEEILKLVSKPEEYERVKEEWKAGIEP